MLITVASLTAGRLRSKLPQNWKLETLHGHEDLSAHSFEGRSTIQGRVFRTRVPPPVAERSKAEPNQTYVNAERSAKGRALEVH